MCICLQYCQTVQRKKECQNIEQANEEKVGEEIRTCLEEAGPTSMPKKDNKKRKQPIP